MDASLRFESTPFISQTASTFFALAMVSGAAMAAEPVDANAYARWKNGPPQDSSFFPVAVWMQSPANAKAFQKAGINTYVGLWQGPTEKQLADLKSAGMKLICNQNEVAQKHLNDRTIIGWMHGDEPDNAQRLGGNKGYGPPIPPEKIVDDYRRIQAVDSSRPVLLNLGQGVAWDKYKGRGVRCNHPEDYQEYVKGCDIASFDIYPVAHPSPEVVGKLDFVAHGVERLVRWTRPERIAWNCIECTHISANTKASPQQVRAEVWMSLIHGSRGLIYFVHEFKPKFIEAGLLSDSEMLAGVTAINRQIIDLAPVLNGPTLKDSVSATPTNSTRCVATMAKKGKGCIYVFAVGMSGTEGNAEIEFRVKDLTGKGTVDVLDENRTLPIESGIFKDSMEPWGVHLYRVAAPILR